MAAIIRLNSKNKYDLIKPCKNRKLLLLFDKEQHKKTPLSGIFLSKIEKKTGELERPMKNCQNIFLLLFISLEFLFR